MVTGTFFIKSHHVGVLFGFGATRLMQSKSRRFFSSSMLKPRSK